VSNTIDRKPQKTADTRSDITLPDPADVAALTYLLDLMANFPSNEQRARYLLSCNWMRDHDAAIARGDTT